MARSPRKTQSDNVLTGIPIRIHCAATTDGGGNDELERIQVEHFLNTLARIALAVASRERANDQRE